MPLFPLLAEPQRYSACETDLLRDHAARAHWLKVYRDHTEVQLTAAASIGVPREAIDAARTDWLAELERISDQPDRHGRLDILLLDDLRKAALNGHGIRDEFHLLKQRENDAALKTLPRRLRELDAMNDDHQRLVALFQGILAGNLFDMGVQETSQRYAQGPVPFDETLAAVPPRPWHVDDVDAAFEQLQGMNAGRALLFADNAGADVTLGLLPLTRELLWRNWQVVITANSEYAHNDITHDELIGLLDRAAAVDSIFHSPQLSLVPSGNDAPLIDLRRISDELAAAAVGTDLLVLIGMGRAVESNYSARFTCACWKIAMLKDAQVAASVGGQVFDAVVKVENPNKSTSQNVKKSTSD